MSSSDAEEKKPLLPETSGFLGSGKKHDIVSAVVPTQHGVHVAGHSAHKVGEKCM